MWLVVSLSRVLSLSFSLSLYFFQSHSHLKKKLGRDTEKRGGVVVFCVTKETFIENSAAFQAFHLRHPVFSSYFFFDFLFLMPIPAVKGLKKWTVVHKPAHWLEPRGSLLYCSFLWKRRKIFQFLASKPFPGSFNRLVASAVQLFSYPLSRAPRLSAPPVLGSSTPPPSILSSSLGTCSYETFPQREYAVRICLRLHYFS